MTKMVFIMAHAEARRRAVQAVQDAQEGFAVTISEPTRSLEQNSALWRILQAFADQLQWPVNGKLEWLNAEEWKDILSAAFQRESVRLAAGLDGGIVMLGQRTSKFSKRQFSDFLEFLNATAATRGVKFDYMEHA